MEKNSRQVPEHETQASQLKIDQNLKQSPIYLLERIYRK